VQKKRKIIVITLEKNPRLYRVLLRKGGTAMIGNVIMTIMKPKKSFVENFTLKIKSIFN
jgi:hypothetical protein